MLAPRTPPPENSSTFKIYCNFLKFFKYRNCVYFSYIVRFNTDKIDIGFYHVLRDLFTLDCTARNTHNYVNLFIYICILLC